MKQTGSITGSSYRIGGEASTADSGLWWTLPITVALPKGGGVDVPISGRRSLSAIACRFLNIVAALTLLVFAAPIMLVVAIAVRLTSEGPIIYSQERVGIDRRATGRRAEPEERRRSDQGGRIFRIYKFRTMYVDAEERQVWAKKGDPRITPVGAVLRAYRLDELPQLVNVLMGDMNLVGPRPEQPKIFEELRQELPAYPLRQKVRPGITGWAQVNQGYDTSLEDVTSKLRLDLEYIDRRSPMKDLMIMARTPAVMVTRQGSR